jgi:RNA polymerase sigma-70 factor (ECF subfamily)
MTESSARVSSPALEGQVRALLEQGARDDAATLAIDSASPDILGYLQTRLDDDDANDALSQWRESVWKDLRHFRWECSLRAWAYSLARHACARIRRRPHRHREQPLSTSAASRIAASIGASAALSSERQQKLALLREALDEDERELLTLRVDRELEWEEVAAVLDASAVALRKRWERLVRKLEQMARKAGLLE